jgi:hypothetical protein
VKISEQQLVDCVYVDDNGYSTGCSGGLMTDAFQYTIYNNGTIYSEYYPVTYILKNILN